MNRLAVVGLAVLVCCSPACTGELKERNRELVTEVDALRGANSEATRSVDRLTTQLSARDKALTEANQSAAQARAAAEESKAVAVKATGDAEEARRAAGEADRRAAAATAEASAAKDQRDAAIKRADQATADLSTSKGASDATASDMTNLKAKIAQLETDLKSAIEHRERATFERDEALKVNEAMTVEEEKPAENSVAVVAIVASIIGAVAMLLIGAARKSLSGS